MTLLPSFCRKLSSIRLTLIVNELDYFQKIREGSAERHDPAAAAKHGIIT